ncbi:hypothetical protein [Chitinophaga filiformis]|uniref:Uncharacterized protein n=1 Tax=Chitinophaga filiformis TaxID=104663 RepID=A0ABY4IAZ0_CHIFI|nr:hypothetical protein [Chitinophaga filiformis]UPK72489.1 hypothetical protein MYF79_14445 [Chitinophaga filiformis]
MLSNDSLNGNDPYFLFSNGIYDQELDQLFPLQPISNNMLYDINRRMVNLPYYWRKNVMIHLCYTNPVFYQKARGIADKGGIVRPLNILEMQAIYNITNNVIDAFQAYLKTTYNQEFDKL